MLYLFFLHFDFHIFTYVGLKSYLREILGCLLIIAFLLTKGNVPASFQIFSCTFWNWNFEILFYVFTNGPNKILVNKKRETSNLAFKKSIIIDEEFNELSDDAKYNHLNKFFGNELRKVKSGWDEKKERNVIVNETVFELYNNQTEKLDDEYNELSDVEKKIS